MRLIFALLLGKIALFLTRFFQKGGGTALPGLIVNSLYPPFVQKLTENLKEGSIVITGTNGKTTTSRILSSILKESGYLPIHNRAGSNLMRGIASTLIKQSNWKGRVRADIGIWEVDEAALPYVVQSTLPRFLIITNLFRDQLDRYGEIDKTKSIWGKVLSTIPPGTKAVFCSDDPNLAYLGSKVRGKVFYFGIQDRSFAHTTLSSSADCLQCPQCNSFLSFPSSFFSHLSSDYFCPKCSFCHPANYAFCKTILFKKTKFTQTEIIMGSDKLNLKVHLIGLYNVYNLLAAVTTAHLLGISLKAIKKGVEKFRPPFGRVEEIQSGRKKILLLLCKNPTGFNQVLATIAQEGKKLNLLIAVNDLIADGRDVSWLWDVHFEHLRKKVGNLVISGIRAEDLALRLKYAGWIVTNGERKIEKNYKKAVELGLQQTKEGETLYILPTYTAMLAIRKSLVKMGLTHKSWQD